ncbi:MAG: ferrous iron transport protein A [Desulfovibrionaceae bacterium]
MRMNLSEAPTGVPLVLTRITDPLLAERLGRMGLFPGAKVERWDAEVALHTARIRGPRGELVLGGGMGGKMVVHLDDGRMLPLSELAPGERGHLEGITGGEGLAETLRALGLQNDDAVELVRKLPPMEYVTALEGRRVRLAEGLAAKLLGSMGSVRCQFANASAGAPFVVERMLGGERARRALGALGVAEGSTLVLVAVEPASSHGLPGGDRVVLHSGEGLRLYLRLDQAKQVIVTTADE